MSKQKLSDELEQLHIDYALLKSFCDELIDENKKIKKELKIAENSKEHLEKESYQLKVIISIILGMKIPLDGKLSAFFRETILENLTHSPQHPQPQLDDEIPF